MTDDEVFEVLERAAVAGERCPPSRGGGLSSQITARLARAGRIRIDLYFHNWRVVTIMEGPHKGLTTAPCPKPGAKPYLTIGKETAHERGDPAGDWAGAAD